MSKIRKALIGKKAALSIALMLTLTGCTAGGKTNEQLEEEGWVKNPAEQGWVLESESESEDLGEVEGSALAELPAPQVDPDHENPYSAENSSVNVENLDEYLNRSNAVYIDLRDYDDYTEKHFKNFEVVPFFAFLFNEEANTNEEMIQLYGGTPEEPVDVYEQSDAILGSIFPKDKVIFLTCQSGGRVPHLMNILEAKGYDMDKIYNVGGVGQYTDSKYKEYLTDTLEFKVDVDYSVEGLTRN